MPISAEKIRELAARGERQTLDYKRDDYAWGNAAANAELAKDIMNMVNAFGPTAEPAYILLGVDDDGTIVGLATPHQDDADLHQRVDALLIRRPRFTYGAVEVDGLSVGVYEIRPGGRPMYPRRDSGTLRKDVALVRNGTSSVVATPDEIQGWAREDDPARHQLQQLELAKAAAEARPHAALSVDNMENGGDGAKVSIAIENTGRSGFFIDAAEWRGEWNQSALRSGLAEAQFGTDYLPPSGNIETPRGLIPPGKRLRLEFRFTRAQAFDHFKAFDVRYSGYNGSWLAYHVSVQCRTDLGGSETFSCTARQGF